MAAHKLDLDLMSQLQLCRTSIYSDFHFQICSNKKKKNSVLLTFYAMTICKKFLLENSMCLRTIFLLVIFIFSLFILNNPHFVKQNWVTKLWYIVSILLRKMLVIIL